MRLRMSCMSGGTRNRIGMMGKMALDNNLSIQKCRAPVTKVKALAL